MTSPEEFRAAFVMDGIVTFPAEAVSLLPISVADADWMRSIGLPRSVAPFLSFGGKYEINIPTVTDLWGVEECSQYRVIGSNGSGDPVTIDTANGEVVFLNHDFAFHRVFINSTVTALAEVLFAYNLLVDEAQAANGSEAFWDGKIPDESLRKFIASVEAVDPESLKSGMWAGELEQLRGRAESR